MVWIYTVIFDADGGDGGRERQTRITRIIWICTENFDADERWRGTVDADCFFDADLR